RELVLFLFAVENFPALIFRRTSTLTIIPDTPLGVGHGAQLRTWESRPQWRRLVAEQNQGSYGFRTRSPCSRSGMTRAESSVQQRVGRAEHRAGLVAIAILDIDRRGIDAVARDVFQRHGPAARRAVPVTDLEQVAHHVVVGDFTPAIFAAPDRDRHRFRNRADPDLAM